MRTLSLEHITPLQQELNTHAIYGDLKDLEDLKNFMSHHVYSVWDFMSLIKYLQHSVAPTTVPWTPAGDPSVRYFINQLVLEEESDQLTDSLGKRIYSSHFEFYLQAMEEIGADTSGPRAFLEKVVSDGIEKALDDDVVPVPARQFSQTTFCIINEDKPHLAAAALAVGRERIIPGMFRDILRHIGIDSEQAPAFHQYLERHIHLDEDFHADLSMRLLEYLCDEDDKRLEEAEAAAEEAICARMRFWDGVHESIIQSRG